MVDGNRTQRISKTIDMDLPKNQKNVSRKMMWDIYKDRFVLCSKIQNSYSFNTVPINPMVSKEQSFHNFHTQPGNFRKNTYLINLIQELAIIICMNCCCESDGSFLKKKLSTITSIKQSMSLRNFN